MPMLLTVLRNPDPLLKCFPLKSCGRKVLLALFFFEMLAQLIPSCLEDFPERYANLGGMINWTNHHGDSINPFHKMGVKKTKITGKMPCSEAQWDAQRQTFSAQNRAPSSRAAGCCHRLMRIWVKEGARLGAFSLDVTKSSETERIYI